MKTKLCALLMTLLVGCCSVGPKPFASYGADYVIVNNTKFLIDVYQDGRLLVGNVNPGQLVQLQSIWLRRYTIATVTGHSETGEYAGCDSYRFNAAVPETWEVHRLLQPIP